MAALDIEITSAAIKHDANPKQPTEKGIAFQKWYDALRNMLHGQTPEKQKKVALANLEFCRGVGLAPTKTGNDIGYIPKAIGPNTVHVDAVLQTFSTMYANDDYIGERLMAPVRVTKRSNVYFTYTKRDRFAYPDDSLSSRATPNEIDASRTTDNYSVADYGYKNHLDLETLSNQDAPLDEMVDVVAAINEGIAFRRELRISTIMQAGANYGGNTAGAGTIWDTANTGGTIIADLLAADAALWKGMTPVRKIAFTTLDNWNTCIAVNPQILDRIKYTQLGLITPTLIANFFGFDDLLIARARQDTANSGQTAAYSRIWSSNIFGLVQVATNPTTRSLHFGSTFRMAEDPVTTQWIDQDIGKKGGLWARVAVSEQHKVVAGDAGYLITTVK